MRTEVDTESAEANFLVRPRLWVALADWERLRWVYNLVLLGYGLDQTWQLRNANWGLMPGGYWGGVLIFGLLANVCYCLGPLAEVYIFFATGAALGRTRRTLFSSGLVFSILLVELVARAVHRI